MSIGRNLPYIKSPVIYMDGIDPFCPIRSQIFLPEITTGFSAEAIHPFSQFSPIEAFSITLGNFFQCFYMIGQSHRFPNLRDFSIRHKSFEPACKSRSAFILHEKIFPRFPEFLDCRRDRISFCSIFYSWSKKLFKGKSAKLFMKLSPCRNSTWNSYREPASLRHFIMPSTFHDIPCKQSRCIPTPIQSIQLVFEPHQCKSITSQPITVGLYHGQTNCRGNGCIDGIAPFLEDTKASLCSQWLPRTNHPLPGKYDPSAGSIWVSGRIKRKPHCCSSPIVNNSLMRNPFQHILFYIL